MLQNLLLLSCFNLLVCGVCNMVLPSHNSANDNTNVNQLRPKNINVNQIRQMKSVQEPAVISRKYRRYYIGKRDKDDFSNNKNNNFTSQISGNNNNNNNYNNNNNNFDFNYDEKDQIKHFNLMNQQIFFPNRQLIPVVNKLDEKFTNKKPQTTATFNGDKIETDINARKLLNMTENELRDLEVEIGKSVLKKILSNQNTESMKSQEMIKFVKSKNGTKISSRPCSWANLYKQTMNTNRKKNSVRPSSGKRMMLSHMKNSLRKQTSKNKKKYAMMTEDHNYKQTTCIHNTSKKMKNIKHKQNQKYQNYENYITEKFRVMITRLPILRREHIIDKSKRIKINLALFNKSDDKIKINPALLHKSDRVKINPTINGLATIINGIVTNIAKFKDNFTNNITSKPPFNSNVTNIDKFKDNFTNNITSITPINGIVTNIARFKDNFTNNIASIKPNYGIITKIAALKYYFINNITSTPPIAHEEKRKQADTNESEKISYNINDDMSLHKENLSQNIPIKVQGMPFVLTIKTEVVTNITANVKKKKKKM